jgi:exopolysaccharide biosynthesis polyprenyl glycosylphosphotransferase
MGAVSDDAVVAVPGEQALRQGLSVRAVRHSRGWLMRRLLVLADLVGLMSAYLLALLLRPATEADTVSAGWELALVALTLPFWVVLARVHGLYDRDEERSDHSTVDDVVGVFQVVTLGTWGLFVATYVLQLPHPMLSRIIVFWFLAVLLVPLLRGAMRVIGRRQDAYIQNVIIVGSGEVAHLLESKIRKHPEYGLRMVGFVDNGADAAVNGGESVELLGGTDELPALVRDLGVDRVVIAFSSDSHEQTLEVVRATQSSDVQIDIVPRMFEVLGTNVQVHTIEGVPLVGLPVPRLSQSEKFLKRTLDLVGATLGLVVFAPFFLLTAVLIKLDSRGPVFFTQVRMGMGNRKFRVYKFRTMVRDAESRKSEIAHLNVHRAFDARMFKVANDPRITRVGRFLRRWRIDEVPQLLNVIRGEMSLVGPRPLILDEDQYVERWARRRLNLKPGMTGLWQVLGASDIPFEEMTKLDYLYVTTWSLREDLRLILLTLPALVREHSAY